MLSPYCGCYSCRPSDGTSWNLARLFVTCQHSFLLKLPAQILIAHLSTTVLPEKDNHGLKKVPLGFKIWDSSQEGIVINVKMLSGTWD